MTKPWRVRPSAEREIEAAIDWYEARGRGVGADLRALVTEGIARLRAEPNLGGPVLGVGGPVPFRRLLLPRFPYALVFVELDDAYELVALMHLRRRPGYWTK